MKAHSVRLPVDTLTLENGLQVVLSVDHTAPIVAVNLWYNVGSANERPKRTGFAHLFEHMLFQGSEHVAANEHFELVQRAGGTLNGSTWLDRTNYFETLPSNQLELALWLEADRMGDLLPAMTQEKLDTQRDVVKNERRWSMDNQPYGSWWERLPALAFPAEHPYHHSLIGSMEDLDAATLTDVVEFFKTYYTPDNAVLSIVGDFEPHDARRLVRQHFGFIPCGQGRPPLPEMALPPSFGAPLREVVDDDVMVPRLFLAFRSPIFGTDEYYVAAVIGAVLGLNRGSRLYKRLVRQSRVASSVSVFSFDLSKGSDLLVVDVTAMPGISTETLEDAVATELDHFHTHGGNAPEVERAIALLTTDYINSLQAAQTRADKLSQFATYCQDPALVNAQVSKYEHVAVEAVTRFAFERLHPGNRASLVYRPRDTAAKSAQ